MYVYIHTIKALVAALACACNLMGVVVLRPYADDRCSIAEAGGQMLLLSLLLIGQVYSRRVTARASLGVL